MSASDFLSVPLESQPGIPLRVSVYTRIAEAIRSGQLRPASLVPSETELGMRLGVSRTVVREALMLLAEDGLVRSHRGVGRFVSDHAPRIGLERLRPIEDVLAEDSAPVALRRTRETLEPSSAAFVADGLSIDAGDPSWLWESVVERNGETVALLQEHFPAGRQLERFGPAVTAAVEAASGTDGSLLRTLLGLLDASVGPSRSEIALGVPGSTRGRLLGVSSSEPVLILTQLAEFEGRPLYLAKQLLTSRAGNLTIAHLPAPRRDRLATAGPGGR
jgi:GntR family transcriptional regulator